MSGVVQAQDGTSSTGEETKDYIFTCLALRLNCHLQAKQRVVMSIVKGCAGSIDGCRGCGPCLSQHSTKAADIHDKPGQSLSNVWAKVLVL